MTNSPFTTILSSHQPDLPTYEEIYKHLHAHPELSRQESNTAAYIAEHLRGLSSELEIRTGIGGHGLIAILENGSGKTVLLRADFDALPVTEKTGLEYASTVRVKGDDGTERGVMHACGHDFHVTSLLACASRLLSSRAEWSGTVVFLFQPAEETGSGARAMVDDGLYSKDKHNCPIPDVVLGQHVFPYRAGSVATRSGPVMSAADSFKITIFGSGGHGSMPHRCIDPVVIASHIVVRLQTIVSREVPPGEIAVVTVGALQSGFTENVISDEALLRINIRTVTKVWRERILESVKRIVKAECEAGRCRKEPTFEKTSTFPLTDNNAELFDKVSETFTNHFGDNYEPHMEKVLGSEDFGILGTAVDKPYCFWFFGGTDADEWDKHEKEGMLNELPANHSPYFAPVIQPTLKTGMDAISVAALTFLMKK